MLKDKLKKYNVILASGSPRRQELFAELGIKFKIQLKKIEETYPKELKKEQITDFLANLKSKPFLKELSEKDLLITSDTIVWLKNEALGKPKNNNEAFDMLKKLSAKKHKVITSVSIRSKRFQQIFNSTTIVEFKKLHNNEIEYYVKNFKPFDKAGAYGIQEWIGKIGVKKIKGCYFNVVGLPISKLYNNLENII